MPTVQSEPTFARIASITSTVRRRRFSSEPPYSSVRWFVYAVQNWSSR